MIYEHDYDLKSIHNKVCKDPRYNDHPITHYYSGFIVDCISVLCFELENVYTTGSPPSFNDFKDHYFKEFKKIAANINFKQTSELNFKLFTIMTNIAILNGDMGFPKFVSCFGSMLQVEYLESIGGVLNSAVEEGDDYYEYFYGALLGCSNEKFKQLLIVQDHDTIAKREENGCISIVHTIKIDYFPQFHLLYRRGSPQLSKEDILFLCCKYEATDIAHSFISENGFNLIKPVEFMQESSAHFATKIAEVMINHGVVKQIKEVSTLKGVL